MMPHLGWSRKGEFETRSSGDALREAFAWADQSPTANGAGELLVEKSIDFWHSRVAKTTMPLRLFGICAPNVRNR